MIFQLSQWLLISFFHFLWIGCLLLLFVALLERLVSWSVKWRYRINLVAFFCLLAIVPISFNLTGFPETAFLVPAGGTTVENSTEVASTTLIHPSGRQEPNPLKAIENGIPEPHSAELHESDIDPPNPSLSRSQDSTRPINQRISSESSSNIYRPLTVFLGISYFLGLVGMISRLTWMTVNLQRFRHQSPAQRSEGFDSMLLKLCNRIGLNNLPSIVITKQLDCPSVYGILSPVIFVPAWMLTGFTEKELESIFLHELIHIKRLDPLVLWIQRISEAFFFFHPAIWLVSRRLDFLREHCCDQQVVSLGIPAIEYARNLCKVAENRPGINNQELVNAFQKENPMELLKRIKSILNKDQQSTFHVSPKSLVTTILLLFFSLSSISLISAGTKKALQEESKVTTAKSMHYISVSVFSPQKAPVSDASIRYFDPRIGKWKQTRTKKDGTCTIPRLLNFEEELAPVYVISKDRKFIGSTQFAYNTESIKMTLKKSTKRKVRVQKNGQAVEGAEISVDSNRFWSESPTKKNGLAEVYLPEKESNVQFIAFHEKYGVATANQVKDDLVTIKLLPTKSVRVTVLDDLDRPAPGVPIHFGAALDDSIYFTTFRTERNNFRSDKNGEILLEGIPLHKNSNLTFFSSNTNIYREERTKNQRVKKDKNNPIVYVRRDDETNIIKGTIDFGSLQNNQPILINYIVDTPDGIRPVKRAYSDVNGKFELKVAWNKDYLVKICDPRWTSSTSWHKFDASSKPIEIFAEKTIPLKIVLTGGKNKKPVENAHVYIENPLPRILPFPSQRIGDFIVSARGGRTDEEGIASFGASKGTVSITVTHKTWKKTKNVVLTGGQPKVVHFHSDTFGERNVFGSVTGPKDVSLKEVQVDVHPLIWGTKKRKAKVDPNGKWTVDKFKFYDAAALAKTQDLGHAGIRFAKSLKKNAGKIRLKPSSTIVGQILDSNQKPIAGLTLQLVLTRKTLFGFNGDEVFYNTVKTDQEGKFRFEGVIGGYTHKVVLLENGKPNLLHTSNLKKIEIDQTYDFGPIQFRLDGIL